MRSHPSEFRDEIRSHSLLKPSAGSFRFLLSCVVVLVEARHRAFAAGPPLHAQHFSRRSLAAVPAALGHRSFARYKRSRYDISARCHGVCITPDALCFRVAT